MAWVRCCGSAKKSNPILFADGAWAAGLAMVHCRYSSNAPYGTGVLTINASGYLAGSAQNGGYTAGGYVEYDLTQYVGKKLYYEYSIMNGSWQTRAFNITSSSKKPVLGVFSDGTFKLGFGITNLETPTAWNTNSDVYTYNCGDYNSSPSNPILRIRKIYVGD